MEEKYNNIQLTSAEVGNLWNQYINDSMNLCIVSHFVEHCKDEDVTSILKQSIDLSKSHLQSIRDFLSKEGHPIPKGFTKEDVNLDAPPLFPDHLILIYLQAMTLHGMNGYSLSTGTSTRKDQRSYFMKCSNEAMDLYDTLIDTMLDKGVLSKTPQINPPHDVDFVHRQSFLTGWFGKRRPLNAIEVNSLHHNMVKTTVKVMLEIAFSQVAKSKEVRDYLLRGMKVCESQLKAMSEALSESHLPSPRYWQSDVTDSTVAPFSDRLMLTHVVLLVSAAIGYYGTALSVCQRRDLSLKYTRLIAEISLYAEDGTNLLIKNGWLEQPPTFIDREALAKKDNSPQND